MTEPIPQGPISGETPKPKEIPTELPLITLETPLEEILAKRSAINPFPEQAKGDIWVWSEGDNILYLGTGNIYRGHFPVYYPVDSVLEQKPLQMEDLTYRYNDEERCLSGWEGLPGRLTDLAGALVGEEIRRKTVGDVLSEWKKATTKEEVIEGKTEAVAEAPAKALVNAVKRATALVESGNWKEAYSFISLFRTWAVQDREGEKDESFFSLLPYIEHQLAHDVIPNLGENIFHNIYAPDADRGGMTTTGYTNFVCGNIGREITSLLEATIKSKALEKMLEKYSHSQTAQSRIKEVLLIEGNRIVRNKYNLQHSRGIRYDAEENEIEDDKTHYEHVKQYFLSQGINLLED